MPRALALTKRLFHELDGLGFEDGIRLGARVNAQARQTPDFREAIARFLREVTPLRIGLAMAGFAAALLAVILDQPRVVWGAIALLTGSLIVRLLQRRNGGV